ncbi:hypothetical protein EYF80_065090 [Liparis tanakae]|uniref:Uncharacterized protein n=1 Tax=Liparis tanakae TaxID=230148 RepID=A0A4Z2E8B8_9TELE|nr:hypothetical protein EYF80_065090 [Liparis tanakae]
MAALLKGRKHVVNSVDIEEEESSKTPGPTGSAPRLHPAGGRSVEKEGVDGLPLHPPPPPPPPPSSTLLLHPPPPPPSSSSTLGPLQSSRTLRLLLHVHDSSSRHRSLRWTHVRLVQAKLKAPLPGRCPSEVVEVTVSGRQSARRSGEYSLTPAAEEEEEEEEEEEGPLLRVEQHGHVIHV